MVSSLVETYARHRLDWVKHGLPPEVNKSETSQEPAKSK